MYDGRGDPQEQEEICNIEAEQQILGAILTNNALFDKVSDLLKVDHFYDPVHARIYERAAQRITEDQLVSPVTMKVDFENDAGLKDIGGPAYLVRMAGASISSFAIRDYATSVIDAWARRKLVEAARETINRLSHGGDLAEARNDLETQIGQLQVVSDKVPFLSLARATEQMARNLTEAYQEERDPGIAIGYPSIDNLLGGLAGGDVCIVAGATSMGKTTVGLAFADKIAQRGEAVAVVSLEMNDESLVRRLVSTVSEVPYQAMRRASKLEQHEVRKIIEATAPVSQKPIYIVPPYIRDVAGISGAVRAIKAEAAARGQRLAMVLIDYLQLVRAPGRNRFDEVTNASIAMKALAGQLDVPVVALAQLSRQIGERDDKRPRLSDIRESGQIEQDADQVVFCHREEYWLQRETPPKSVELRADYEAALAASKGIVQLIVAKNRHGSLGDVELSLDVATNKLTEKYGGDHRQEGMDF